MRKSVQVQLVALAVLGVLTAGIWYAVVREERGGMLTVSFLSVGKGEAIFIDAPSGRQVLIDGGPDGGVLRQLGSVMPPWDRTIDMVVATSPDPSDNGGLADVLTRYRVTTVLQTSVQNTSAPWNLFEKEASASDIRTARRGQVVDLGSGVSLQVLFPDRNILDAGTGEGCVVLRLSYGATSFLLPCDSTVGVQQYLAALDMKSLKSDVLLVRGVSPAKLSPILLGYVAPSFVVVSGSCTSVSSTLPFGSKAHVLDTCQGAMTFVSDGKTLRVR